MNTNITREMRGEGDRQREREKGAMGILYLARVLLCMDQQRLLFSNTTGFFKLRMPFVLLNGARKWNFFISSYYKLTVMYIVESIIRVLLMVKVKTTPRGL